MKLFNLVDRIYHSLRKRFWFFYCKRQLKSHGKRLAINGHSHFNHNVVVGDDCCFNGMYIQGGGSVTIGNNFHSGIQCMMITSKHNYDCGEMIPYDYTAYTTDILIDDFVWLGNRVTIVGPVHIGKGAILGTSAIITKDVPAYAIMGGVNKVLKYRDIEHFESLEKAGKFWIDKKFENK